ncbi:MAG: hypothetical protein WA733_05110, partial [Methylocystis sp.]
MVPPVGHDRQGIRAFDVGAIDEIASAGVARVVVDKLVFAAMLADAIVYSISPLLRIGFPDSLGPSFEKGIRMGNVTSMDLRSRIVQAV